MKEQFTLSARDTTLGDYWRILRKRKWTVIASAVTVVGFAAIVSLQMTPIYDAAARISIDSQPSNLLSFKDSPMQPVGADQGMETQARILQLDSLASDVIQKLHLDQNKDFARPLPANKGTSARDVLIRQDRLLTSFRKNLHVQVVPNTTLIEVKFSNKNPQLSAQIANEVVSTFIERNIRARYDSTMSAADWLSKQLATLKVTVESAQLKLVEYQRTHGIFGVDDKQNITVERLSDLNRELTTAQADRILKNSIYQTAKNSRGEAATAVLQDPLLSSLRQQQADLQAQRAQLSTEFGPSYPKIQELDNRLRQVEKSYKEQLEVATRKVLNDYHAALKREDMLKAELEVQKGETEKLNENAIQFKALKEDAESNRQLYEGLLQKLNEASLIAGLNSSNVTVVDPARVPVRPAKPNFPQYLGFALLLGLVGGVACAFALEALDTTVRTPDQAEEITGLPVIGLIPALGSLERKASLKSRLFNLAPATNPALMAKIAFMEPKSEIAEAYRALRTSILLSSAGHQPHTILVTSSLPQDGKSVTSINIAVVLAQQGKRVLIVDADLRRPSIQKCLGLAQKAVLGLSNVLTGGVSAEDAIVSTFQPNLYALLAGPMPPQPSELLSSDLMRELLEKWRGNYDHIIVDTPPILSVTDAVILSPTMDAVILVARSAQTTTTAIRRSLNLLYYAQARVLGVVMNAIDFKSPDYYYYYYSSSRYGGYGSRYGGYYGEKGASETSPELEAPEDREAARGADTHEDS